MSGRPQLNQHMQRMPSPASNTTPKLSYMPAGRDDGQTLDKSDNLSGNPSLKPFCFLAFSDSLFL
eukprot:gene52893-70718_t